MYVRIVTFRLDGATLDELAPAAADLAPCVAAWPGLHAKVWIADHVEGTVGGVYLFEDRAAADRSRGTAEFRAVVDDPAHVDVAVQEFDVLGDLTAVTAGPLAALLPSAAVAGPA